MFSEIVVCSLVYIAIVAIAYAPKPAATEPAPINYFPEPTEPQADQLEKLPETETIRYTGIPLIETANTAIAPALTATPETAKPALKNLSLSELKKMARSQGIRNTARLNRSEVIKKLEVLAA
jgi:hypothetical protein